MANGRKTSVAFIAISAVILVVASSVGFAYAEDKTIFTAYSSGDGNLNMIEITGDYKFDKYMEEGSFGLDELYDFLADNVTHGERINGVNPVNCSTFMVLDADGSGYLAGRNFDFRYCTPMLVFTHPDGGYASVSTVDARMFGNTGETISEIMSDSRFNAAAYIPMDGINEKGVYVAINSVSKEMGVIEMNPGKVPMFTTSALRLILDYADSVDKAIELVQQFNLNSLGNFHIAVGDRTGKMAVIEYQTVITTTLETQRHITMLADADKKVVTNHFLFDGAPAAKNPGSLERYATIHDALTENPTMYKYQVAQVLKSVQQDNPDKKHYTRWSVVYDLDECSASIFIRDGEIMAFNHPYLYDVWGYNGSIYLPFPNEDVMAIGNRNELALA